MHADEPRAWFADEPVHCSLLQEPPRSAPLLGPDRARPAHQGAALGCLRGICLRLLPAGCLPRGTPAMLAKVWPALIADACAPRWPAYCMLCTQITAPCSPLDQLQTTGRRGKTVGGESLLARCVFLLPGWWQHVLLPAHQTVRSCGPALVVLPAKPGLLLPPNADPSSLPAPASPAVAGKKK